jgi:sugar phosphate isomerase/epimerase
MQFQVAVVNWIQRSRLFPQTSRPVYFSTFGRLVIGKDAQVPIGQGDVNWDDFFEAAKTGGVKNFYVEMAPETFGPSAEFLKKV